MPRYARMLEQGMRERGHEVAVCTAKPFFYKLPVPVSVKKWMGYLDQYILFPIMFKLGRKSENTLYVFADQALGPWIPLVQNKPHVIHCHDFLAQRSALGEVEENKTSKTGRWYQHFIRWGYQHGRYFISISKSTQQDLHRLLQTKPLVSEVVYNGLNQKFIPGKPFNIRAELSEELKIDLHSGYILHVGGNQFYKNRIGVLEIFEAFTAQTKDSIPLLLIGSIPTKTLLDKKEKMHFKDRVYFLQGLSDETLKKIYQGASVMLYPSLEEGFGWPIAEAHASGCPVITTHKAPMSEVGGDSVLYVIRRTEKNVDDFINDGVTGLKRVMSWSPQEREDFVNKGLINAKRFETNHALNEIEKVYKKVYTLHHSL